MSSLVLLLLLCSFLHACTASHLNEKEMLQFGKDLEKLKLKSKTLISSRSKQEVANGAASGSLVSGTEITRSPFQIDHVPPSNIIKHERMRQTIFHEANKIMERHVRLMLGYAQQFRNKETMEPKENDEAEDIVEMDYAQPHKKPPIHNKKP